MGVETAAAVAVAGTAMKMYGDHERSKAQAEAARAQADAKRMQAYDLLERADFNIAATEREGEEFMAHQVGSYVSGGVEIEGSALLALEDTAHKLSVNMINQRKEADAKAQALFTGADIDVQLSGDIESAAKWQMYGTATATAAQMGG